MCYAQLFFTIQSCTSFFIRVIFEFASLVAEDVIEEHAQQLGQNSNLIEFLALNGMLWAKHKGTTLLRMVMNVDEGEHTARIILLTASDQLLKLNYFRL